MFSLRHQNDTICLWVELNMHRPYFEGSFRHNSVMMFGETFHCAALVALDRRFGVNVVLGKANRILGDKLYEFISSVATACDQVSSSQSISVLTTGPPKIRLDRCTSIIAYCIAADPSISERIRDLFISGALRLVKHRLPRDVMWDCFGVDFFKMECQVISLFLRKTPIKNNPGHRRFASIAVPRSSLIVLRRTQVSASGFAISLFQVRFALLSIGCLATSCGIALVLTSSRWSARSYPFSCVRRPSKITPSLTPHRYMYRVLSTWLLVWASRPYCSAATDRRMSQASFSTGTW